MTVTVTVSFSVTVTVKICDGLIGTTVIPGPSDVVTEVAGGAAEEGVGAAV